MAAECEDLMATGFEGYVICAFESRLHSNLAVHQTRSIRESSERSSLMAFRLQY